MCPRQHNEETIALGFWANALITFGLCLIGTDHHLSIITPAFLLGRAGSHSFLSLQPLLHVCENTASLPHHEFSEHWDLCLISYSFFHRVCVGSHFTDPVCTLRYLHWGSSLFRVLDWNPSPAIVFPLLHFIIYLFTYLLARQNCTLRGKKKTHNRGHVWTQASAVRAVLTWVSYLTSLSFDFPWLKQSKTCIKIHQ